MNVYLTQMTDGKFTAALTDQNKEETLVSLHFSGSGERLVGFVSIEGKEALEHLKSIVTFNMNGEADENLCNALQDLLGEVFSAGVAHGGVELNMLVRASFTAGENLGRLKGHL